MEFAGSPSIESWPGPAEMIGFTVLALAAGRALLSFLPAGSVGSHRARDLPLTLAVSWQLGLWFSSATSFGSTAAAAFGSSVVASVILIVVAIARRLHGPLAFVPPRPGPIGRIGPLAAGLLVAALAFCLVPLARKPDAYGTPSWMQPLLMAQVGAFVFHAASSARRVPAGAAFATLLVLFPLAAFDDAVLFVVSAQIAVAMGCAFAIGWLRRADRRELALAAFGFASLSRFSIPAALAGLAALVVLTPSAGRLSAGVAALVASALVRIPILDQFESWLPPNDLHESLRHAPIPALAFAPEVLRNIVIALAGLAAIALGSGVCGGGLDESAASAPRREARAVVLFLALAWALWAVEPYLLAESVIGWWQPNWTTHALVLAPAAAILAGLVFLREARE